MILDEIVADVAIELAAKKKTYGVDGDVRNAEAQSPPLDFYLRFTGQLSPSHR